MDENTKSPPGDMDDAYVIEDTNDSIEEIEREMRETAAEAVADVDAAAAAAGDQALRDENQQLRDRVMRTLADYDNFRKRSEREKAEFFRYALGGVMKDVLPVLDNFDRALEHADEGDEIHRGVLLIYKQFYDVLQKHGLTVIDQAGVRFDPNIHEGVVREEDPSLPSHTVAAILQKGYFLHDRLLRPAMVKVAVGGPEPAES